MSLTKSFTIGSLRCHTIEAGSQALDGGAMFGVVPKPLWEKKIPADDRNRIRLSMRCLLIEHPDGLVLVDSGIGNKESEKFKDLYGVDNAAPNGGTQLEMALGELGFAPSDVKILLNTHLHFDHAGGNTRFDPEGEAEVPVPTFPNASYVVQAREFDFGLDSNERTAGSYLPKNFQPVAEAGLWSFLDGPGEVVPGVEVVLTPGHVPFHQSVMVKDGGETACFLGDVVPTTAHCPLPWIMGYDLEPVVTLESKRALLAKAEAEGWLMVFEHDPEIGLARIIKEGKSYGVTPDLG
ncbi:MAG: MBL fold metallo-hydrolase [Gemmatimonadota bacterium]|nr:MBL fold metallo-hydrolase [Gemmatimonadota bacterium]